MWAESVHRTYGDQAKEFVCDQILQHMRSGDVAGEDLWHAVLEVLWDLEADPDKGGPIIFTPQRR